MKYNTYQAHADLNLCLRELSYSGEEAEKQRLRLISEREEVIQFLRGVCSEHGDNDWEEGLHLKDIIDDYLVRHIGERG